VRRRCAGWPRRGARANRRKQQGQSSEQDLSPERALVNDTPQPQSWSSPEGSSPNELQLARRAEAVALTYDPIEQRAAAARGASDEQDPNRAPPQRRGPSRLSLESHRGIHAELVPCNAHGDSRMPPGFVNKRLSTCAIGLAPVRLVPVAGVRDDNLQGVGNTCGLELGLRASDQ